MRGALLTLVFAAIASAQVCGRNDLFGAYGFRLAGTTTIAGTPKPIAGVGRLAFTADGHINGSSSVNFNGLFLGNPVTGTYTFQDANCALTIELQDDSGALQHFAGTVAPGGARGEFHQTDPGAGGRGTIEKLPESCSAASIRGRYGVTLGSQKTVTMADGNGNLSWTSENVQNSGSYTVDSDCFVEINFGVKLRGILVNGGKTIIAVQSDPDKVSTATFTAQ